MYYYSVTGNMREVKHRTPSTLYGGKSWTLIQPLDFVPPGVLVRCSDRTEYRKSHMEAPDHPPDHLPGHPLGMRLMKGSGWHGPIRVDLDLTVKAHIKAHGCPLWGFSPLEIL